MHILKIFVLLTIQSVIESESKFTPKVEIYWESYLSFPNDHSSCLSKISRQVHKRSVEEPFGINLKSVAGFGADTVTIAFADFNVDRCDRFYECDEIVCGLNLFRHLDEDIFLALVRDIAALRAHGLKVKLAFGGEQWGNLYVPTKTTHVADRVVEKIAQSSEVLGVDGVDLAQAEGCGVRNLRCGDQSSIHLYIIEQLRRRLPDKLISYTFPVTEREEIDFPFRDVLSYGHRNLDSVNLFGAKSNASIWAALKMGVPNAKIVWGVPIGCNVRPFQNITLSEFSRIVKFVKMNELQGVAIWSVNRDTGRRAEPHGGCLPEQTGLEDGTYLFEALSTFN